MQHSVVVIFFLAVATLLVDSKTPYQCQENEAREFCRELTGEDQTRIAGFVRLAFHDCVGDGGCNGCVDLGNGDNGGLSGYMAALKLSYDSHNVSAMMSRADYWILCAHEALAHGLTLGASTDEDKSQLVVNMRYGRVDCNPTEANQSASDSYPNPHNDYNTTTTYFFDQFRLTADETVALLGAHTLGRARVNASGFQQPWVDNEFGLDNQFYIDVLDRSKNWTLRSLNPTKEDRYLQYVQAADGDKNLMFSSDMCLAWNVTSSSDSPGSENDTLPEDHSPGYDTFNKYAMNNGEWLKDFSLAWTKMIEKVTPPAAGGAVIALEDPTADTNPPVCQTVTQTTARPTTEQTTAAASSHTPLAILLAVSVMTKYWLLC